MKIQSTQHRVPGPHMAKGFSLFEMVIVMGIIGLIMGGAIYSMKKIQNTGAITAASNSMSSLEANLEAYKAIGGNYPSQNQGLEALIRKPTDSPIPRLWTKTLDDETKLNDPWGTKYKYNYPGSVDPSEPEIISAGPDKKFGSDDDISSQKI